jgi:signal transduction histidine kinase
LLALFLSLLGSPLWAGETLSVGVLAFRNEAQTTAQWKPLETYLNATVPGFTFTVKALNLKEMRQAISRTQVDLVIIQPAEYVRLTHQNGLSSPLATLLNSDKGKPVRVFGGAIVSRADAVNLNSINDLQGKTAVTASKENFGAYQLQAYSLKKANVVLGSVIETGLSQDAAIDAVRQGKADVAFVRSGLVETMAREGKLDLGDIKIVGQQAFPGYPFAVSTALHPEWPVVALPHVREETAARVAGALLLLPHNSAVPQKIGIYGFSIPSDYESVRTVMRTMKIPPFDVESRVSLADVWEDYRTLILIVLGSMVAVALLAVKSTLLSRQFRDLNETLETRIFDRTAELGHRNAELATTLDQLNLTRDELVESAKLAALGSMVAGIAHELNTPIGNGLTVATTLEDRTSNFKKEMQSGLKRSTLETFVADTAFASDILVRSLDKAATLVSGFKQVAVDQTSSHRRKFMLHDTLSEVLMTLGPSLKSTGCRMLLTEPPDDFELDSYPGPLGQVVTNLITNCVLHGYEDREPGEIRVVVSGADDDHVTIEVSDDGAGVSEANLSRIFEPFFTTRLGKGGSGLGLSIARNIVVGTLGGKLSLKSTPGHGSAFTVWIPLLAPSAVV